MQIYINSSLVTLISDNLIRKILFEVLFYLDVFYCKHRENSQKVLIKTDFYEVIC